MLASEANIGRKRIIGHFCHVVVFDFRSHTQFCPNASNDGLSGPGSSRQPLRILKIYVSISRFKHSEIESLIKENRFVMVESDVGERDVLGSWGSVYRDKM